MSFNRFAVLQDQSSRQQTNKRNNQTKKQSTGPTHKTPTPGDRARKREEKNTTTTESPQKPNKPVGKTLPKNLEEENSKTFIKVESKKPKNEGDDQKTLSKTDFVNERKKGNTPQNQRKNNDGQRRPNRNNNNEVDGQRQGQGQKRGPGGNPQKRGQGQGKGAKKNPGKRNTRAPDSLNNPEGKRTGRGQPPVYNKKVKDNDVKPLWNEEQPTEDVINKDENVDNEKENVNVEQEDSESSEYYIEGNLIEDPKENKLVDAPLNKEKEAVKAKGFKKYLEEKEAQKESLAKLLEKQGLESKTEIPVPEVKVESLNRKEQTLVIENESDLFFVKKDNQTESKKKEKKQQTGPKTVKVSEVFIVKQRRHRGFNTVPSEKPRVFDNNKEKTGTTQTGESSPKTDSPKEKRDNRNYQDRNQGQYRKGPNTGRGRGYKQNVGTKVGNLQDTNQYPSLSNGDVQPLKQWGPEDKN